MSKDIITDQVVTFATFNKKLKKNLIRKKKTWQGLEMSENEEGKEEHEVRKVL